MPNSGIASSCGSLVRSVFLFLPGSVWEDYPFIRISPFLPNCPLNGIYLLTVVSRIFCISVVFVVIFPMSFLFIDLIILSFDESG